MSRRGDISGGIGLLILAAVGLFVVPGRQVLGFDIAMLCWILGGAGLLWLILGIVLEVLAQRNPRSMHLYDGD